MRRSSFLLAPRGVAIAAVVALAACGAEGGGAPGTTDTARTTAAPSSGPSSPVEALVRCADVPMIETDVAGTDVGPRGFDPVLHGVLLTYADEHRDTFGGMWLDREAGGTMVLAFTDDPDAHRAALAARRPSSG